MSDQGTTALITEDFEGELPKIERTETSGVWVDMVKSAEVGKVKRTILQGMDETQADNARRALNQAANTKGFGMKSRLRKETVGKDDADNEVKGWVLYWQLTAEKKGATVDDSEPTAPPAAPDTPPVVESGAAPVEPAKGKKPSAA